MKTELEIQKKLKLLRERKLKRLIRKALRRKPHNCHFNRVHTVIQNGKSVEIPICVAGVERPDWKVDICDSNQQAKTCPIFLLKQDKKAIEKEFDEQCQDTEWLKKEHPDLYLLSWVLDGVSVMRLTLKQRVLLWLMNIGSLFVRAKQKRLPMKPDPNTIIEVLNDLHED